MKINQKSETATLEILYHNGKKTFAVKILGTRDALDVPRLDLYERWRGSWSGHWLRRRITPAKDVHSKIKPLEALIFAKTFREKIHGNLKSWRNCSVVKKYINDL